MTPAALETDDKNTKDQQNINEEDYGEDLSPKKDGGVRKIVLSEGVGSTTTPNASLVSVKYVGRFLNGKEFDSNIGSDPFKFVLGQGTSCKSHDSFIFRIV